MEEAIIDMSSTSNNLFNIALQYVCWLERTFESYRYFNKKYLEIDVGLLKIFVVYLIHCRRRRLKVNENNPKSLRSVISCRILESVYAKIHELQSDNLTYKTPELQLQDLKLLLDTDIKDSWIILLDCYSIQGDDGRVVITDLLDSLVQNLKGILRERDAPISHLMETLQGKLMFLKSLMGFAMLRGVELKQLMDLLIHIEDVAVNAARLISICWFHRDDEQVQNEMQVEISQLMHMKINPVDPSVREIYIQVLTASKVSRSMSQTSAVEDNKLLAATDLIDYLLDSVIEILESCTGLMIPVKDQIVNLLEGLRFLSFLLREQQEKFYQLPDEMKDLIGILVTDAGIVICSLLANQMKAGLDKETDLALFHLLKMLKVIMAEVGQIYPPPTPSSSFPRTNELGSIDFLLENLKELAISEANSVASQKCHIENVLEDLQFLRSFLQNIAEKRNQNEKLQALWNRVMEVTNKAEFVIDSILVGNEPECLDTIAEDIKLTKIEALENNDCVGRDSEAQTRRATKNFIRMASVSVSRLGTPALNEVLVGLDDEVTTIIDRLIRGSKQLDIVSIVGMPGLGKTTLANKVYNDPSVLGHFHIRAWCRVSQVYSKHSLLVQILCSLFSGSPDQYLEMNEDDLAEKLYKCLKGNRYVIVLDDVWHIEACNFLERSFPDDCNGSRILVTSRSHNLSMQIKLDSEPHHLRGLTDEESWALLQIKIFGKESCPPALSELGMQIAKNCKGLPLTVVIVDGILASIDHDSWEEVANSLNSSTVIETEYIKTLDLSYRYLPDYLKPCLLYFSAFEEDHEIPVRKLMLLWISEGFVQNNEAKDLEDLAAEYMMDLINRSLVMVTEQRSVGGAKSCRIHDLVHEFCIAKSKEESFLQVIHASKELFPFSRLYNSHRLCIYYKLTEELNMSRLSFPFLRSLLFFGLGFSMWKMYLFIFRRFRLLRVLDFGPIYLFHDFPREVELLVHLRYLAIHCDLKSIPSAIANLSRLEILILEGLRRIITLPYTIWEMKKLRHLHMKDGSFKLPIHNLEEVSSQLYNLETFSTLYVDFSSENWQKILAKLPSIRRLKCRGNLDLCFSLWNSYGNIALDSLSRLESLKLDSLSRLEFAFPLSLKKLTISSYNQPWNEISTIGKLPNLQVLKLHDKSFLGETWEMEEGDFLKLRFLELKSLDIVRWTSYCENFPPLQKLVLHRCSKLEELPVFLEEIPTIELIEVIFCHESAVSSVKQIQEQQMDLGNEGLKIYILERD